MTLQTTQLPRTATLGLTKDAVDSDQELRAQEKDGTPSFAAMTGAWSKKSLVKKKVQPQ